MIEFIRHERPNNAMSKEYIDRPMEIEKMAAVLKELGCSFHVEFTVGDILYFSIDHPDDDDEPIANTICKNGPDVLSHIDNMITTAYNFVMQNHQKED